MFERLITQYEGLPADMFAGDPADEMYPKDYNCDAINDVCVEHSVKYSSMITAVLISMLSLDSTRNTTDDTRLSVVNLIRSVGCPEYSRT